jgi:hypothetical protein
VGDKKLKKYLEKLQFKNEEEYASWCTMHGFSLIFPKPKHQIDKEETQRKLELYTNSLKKSRKIRSVSALLKLFREKKCDPLKTSFENVLYDRFRVAYKEAKDWGIENLYLDFVEHLDKVSKLTKNDYFKNIFRLLLHCDDWIRSFNNWKPKTHNPKKQFSDLIRHLLVKYEVPLFMDSVWDTDNDLHQSWFIFIGNGGNIRKAKDLPIPINKKQAHYFLQTPDNYSVLHAFRYAQVRSLGGSERLAFAIRDSIHMGLNSERNEFCLSVINFFIKNPMLDLIHVGPIIDYIWYQKYSRTVNGIIQPNFSMNGRSPESLLNTVERWHRQLGKEKKGGNNVWERCKIKEFEKVYGNEQKGTLKIWRIVELCSSRELALEGRAQKNCVASYAYSCAKRQCAIFSLRMDSEIRTTIEVRDNQIYQMRNKYNKNPSKQDIDIIKMWVKREGLKISC